MIAGQHLFLVDNEFCRFCGKPSHKGHPAGVVSGHWTCTGCRRAQDELAAGATESSDTAVEED